MLKNEKTYVIMKPDITQKLSIEIKLNQYSEVITIGKNLGDAFAWFFYRNNRKELDDHFRHNKTGLLILLFLNRLRVLVIVHLLDVVILEKL